MPLSWLQTILDPVCSLPLLSTRLLWSEPLSPPTREPVSLQPPPTCCLHSCSNLLKNTDLAMPLACFKMLLTVPLHTGHYPKPSPQGCLGLTRSHASLHSPCRFRTLQVRVLSAGLLLLLQLIRPEFSSSWLRGWFLLSLTATLWEALLTVLSWVDLPRALHPHPMCAPSIYLL